MNDTIHDLVQVLTDRRAPAECLANTDHLIARLNALDPKMTWLLRRPDDRKAVQS